MHVDDFVLRHDESLYAQWCFFLFRQPAWVQLKFLAYTKEFKLFCQHEGQTYRVTGASRLGDVWLAKDWERDVGYDLRVDVSSCTGWASSPVAPP